VVKDESELLRGLAERFRFAGDFVSAARLGRGHIHDTYVAEYRRDGRPLRYVLQRLNTAIFTDPVALMENLRRITEHLQAKLAARGAPDAERRCLRLVATRTGTALPVDSEGGHWRAFPFIEGTRTSDAIAGPTQAREAARAFAAFAADLRDLRGPPLAVTIPGFHDLPKRMAQLREAIRRDACGRTAATTAESEAGFGLHERLARTLAEDGADRLPTRVMHNDAKLDNLLLDAHTGEGLCVLDLDTVMAGSVLCDFGELVRSGACRAAEDEPDLAVVCFERELFEALAEGYLAGAGGFLTAAERQVMPLAGPTLALENATRFLADHLAGDVYFRTHREGHNLDRARVQLHLTEQMLDQLDSTRRIIAKLAIRTSL
jgi:aminoglycoside phosphotransferase (APT) family kinase protein